MNGAAIADRLRRTVSSGLYAKAELLLAEYRRALDSLPAGTPEREQALHEAAELTEWARRTTLAARAALAAQFASTAGRRAVYCPDPPSRHTWEMAG